MWWLWALLLLAFLAWLRHIRSPWVYVHSLADLDARFPQPDGELSHPRWRGSRLPPVFLNGWHLVAWVDELPPGAVKKVRLHSRDYALFSASDGTLAMLPAYCPHLGADLAVEGRVCGNNLVCPFHHWEFDTRGSCVRIPYSDAPIPAAAHTTSVPLRTFNRAVFAWWDAEQRAPWYELADADVPQLAPDWRYEGRVEYHLRCHVLDVKENLPDNAHLSTLHAEHPFSVLAALHRRGWISLPNRWKANWQPHPAKRHLATALVRNEVRAKRELGGRKSHLPACHF